MNILGLPGVIPATEKWMQDLLLSFADLSTESRIQAYRHWSEDVDPDIDYEASRLKKIDVDLVVAKSLGTFVSTFAFDVYRFKPRQAVFIGSPLKRHAADDYQLLAKFVDSVPTLFIQQTADFNGSFHELGNVVERFPNATLAEVAGDDHVYGNIAELSEIILPLVSDHS